MKKLCLFATALFAVAATQAALIPLVNAGFEQPDKATRDAWGFGWDKIDWGFDDAGPQYDMPGWQEFGAFGDGGSEGSWVVPNSGTFAGYLEGGAFGTYQMTGYTIQAGDIITLGFWAAEDWQAAPGNAQMTGTLFFNAPDTPANVIGSYTATTLGAWTYYETTVAAPAAAIGQELGVQLQNTGIEWALMDDISVGVIPEPATMGLVGFFGAGVLFVRRRLAM